MLAIDNVVVRIAGREILSGATANLPAGRRIGLVGRNGAGKSTLFNVILGRLHPDEGEVSWPSAWKVGAVAQEAPGNDTSLLDTVLEADTERTALLAEAETETDPHRLGDIYLRLGDIDAYTAPSRAAELRVNHFDRVAAREASGERIADAVLLELACELRVSNGEGESRCRCLERTALRVGQDAVVTPVRGGLPDGLHLGGERAQHEPRNRRRGRFLLLLGPGPRPGPDDQQEGQESRRRAHRAPIIRDPARAGRPARPARRAAASGARCRPG